MKPNIATSLLEMNAVPKGSEEDALHIGIAAAQGTTYLLTWNFKHINNAETKVAEEKAKKGVYHRSAVIRESTGKKEAGVLSRASIHNFA